VVGVLIWVPADWAAAELTDLAGADVAVVDPADGQVPSSVTDVEFYVPSFMPTPESTGVMSRMPKLSVVQALTAGVDALRPNLPPGVVLCNARGAHDAATAEWVIAAILGSLREFPRFAREQAASRWAYQHTDSLAEKTVLIVGYGSIGAAVERRLAGFEVTVQRVARRAREGVAGAERLPELLPGADVVVLLVPSTSSTAGMVDARFLASMKDGALLVNAARGSVMDTDALLAEVSKGRLRAALDVTSPEPLPSGHPLWSAPGVLITPHVAASTPLSLKRVARLVREQASSYLRGEPLRNVITDAY
jgi:phosphoglycerate dehydrogenase-like enzyme